MAGHGWLWRRVRWRRILARRARRLDLSLSWCVIGRHWALDARTVGAFGNPHYRLLTLGEVDRFLWQEEVNHGA